MSPPAGTQCREIHRVIVDPDRPTGQVEMYVMALRRDSSLTDAEIHGLLADVVTGVEADAETLREKNEGELADELLLRMSRALGHHLEPDRVLSLCG